MGGADDRCFLPILLQGRGASYLNRAERVGRLRGAKVKIVKPRNDLNQRLKTYSNSQQGGLGRCAPLGGANDREFLPILLQGRGASYLNRAEHAGRLCEAKVKIVKPRKKSDRNNGNFGRFGRFAF